MSNVEKTWASHNESRRFSFRATNYPSVTEPGSRSFVLETKPYQFPFFCVNITAKAKSDCACFIMFICSALSIYVFLETYFSGPAREWAAITGRASDECSFSQHCYWWFRCAFPVHLVTSNPFFCRSRLAFNLRQTHHLPLSSMEENFSLVHMDNVLYQVASNLDWSSLRTFVCFLWSMQPVSVLEY